MHYVVVEDGIVVNRIVSDAALLDSWIHNEEAQIGWMFDGVNFIEPLSEQSFVSPTQTKEQLMEELIALEAKIQAIP